MTTESAPIMLAVPMREWTWTTSSHAIVALVQELPRGSAFVTNNGSPADVSGARNWLADRFMEKQLDYCLWLDSDMVPAPDVGARLLRAARERDLDVLAVPYCHRVFQAGQGKVAQRLLSDSPNLPSSGLHELAWTGFGCTLVHRRVFDRMAKPYFSYPPDLSGAGEDAVFCRKARALGFRIWADFGMEIGHLTLFSAVLRRGAVALEPAL